MSTLIPGQPSTIASWCLLLARTVDSYGVDSRRVFADAGMDLDAASDPNSRFPVAKLTQAWEIAVERTGDICLPLALTRYFQPSNYSALGIAISLSQTLLDGLRRAGQYFQVATDTAAMTLHEDEHHVCVRIEIPPQFKSMASCYSIEAFVATNVTLLRLMSDGRIDPVEVHFEYPRSQGVVEYERFFRCPLRFAAPTTQLRFVRADLERPQMMAIASVASSLDAWMTNYIGRFDRGQKKTDVKVYLMDQLLQRDVHLVDVARHLLLSERSLQRKLTKEGVSFGQLKDQCRSELGQRFVAEGRMALGEIAFMLGFADQSSFTRSFRRWTGVSPTRFAQRPFINGA